MKGLKENALKCLHNGGSPGFGYDVDEAQHIVVNPEEAKLVVMIYSMYLSGYSCRNIADTLNADGEHTKTGKPFTKNYVFRIIKNEKYTGVYVYNRAEGRGYDHKQNTYRSKPPEEIIRIDDGIPAIISKEIWQAAQDRRSSIMLRNTKTMYLLSGKIRCGECGSMMSGFIRKRSNAELFHAYTCKSLKSECNNLKEIDKDSLERYIIKLVRENCRIDERFDRVAQDSPEFRLMLQSHIHSVTVYRRFVLVRLYVDDDVSLFRHGRKEFRTPTQRCFK